MQESIGASQESGQKEIVPLRDDLKTERMQNVCAQGVRKCSGKCKRILPLTEEFFQKRGKWEDGSIRLTSDCKECRRVAHKSYRKRNPHKFTTNPEVRKADQEKYKDSYRVYWKEWTKRKRKEDPQHRLSHNLRGRIWHALKGTKKYKSTPELIGCSIEELKIYLAAKFTEGMTWDNYGEWHIDHMKPCSLFDLTKPEQQQECFNFKNLQPLWEVDNLIKGSKYEK